MNNNKIFRMKYNGPDVEKLLDDVKTKHLLTNEEYNNFNKIVNDNEKVHSHTNLPELNEINKVRMDAWDGKFDDITIKDNRISLWANGEIKKFINLPEVVTPKASEVNIEDTNGNFSASNVEDVLAEMVERIKKLEDEIASLNGSDEING